MTVWSVWYNICCCHLAGQRGDGLRLFGHILLSWSHISGVHSQFCNVCYIILFVILTGGSNSTIASSSQSPVRFSTSDNQSSIRFSLTSQPSSSTVISAMQTQGQFDKSCVQIFCLAAWQLARGTCLVSHRFLTKPMFRVTECARVCEWFGRAYCQFAIPFFHSGKL